MDEPAPVDDEISDIDLDFSELALQHCTSTPFEEKSDPFEAAAPKHEPIREVDCENEQTLQEEQNVVTGDDTVVEANTVPDNNTQNPESSDLFIEENSLGFINVFTEELPVHEIVEKDKDIVKQNQVPSAPEIREAVPLCVLNPQEQIHHPNLSSAQSELVKLNTTFIDIATLKPFTVTELNELYENPYLAAVLSFEDEFVNKELNEEFNYSTHPLYELLVKYQKSRQSLKVNAIDVNEMKHLCQKHYSNSWSFHKGTVRNESYCSDRKLCKASQNYE